MDAHVQRHPQVLPAPSSLFGAVVGELGRGLPDDVVDEGDEEALLAMARRLKRARQA